jgi:hypothetical protein
MSVVQQTPMKTSRTYLTLAVVVVLCAAGLAYSQGWFNWTSSRYEVDGNKVGTEQSIDQNAEMDVVPVTQPTTNPAATPAK